MTADLEGTHPRRLPGEREQRELEADRGTGAQSSFIPPVL